MQFEQALAPAEEIVPAWQIGQLGAVDPEL